MLIQGLWCVCGAHVNDNVASTACPSCGHTHNSDVMAMKRMHTDVKMANVELLRRGEVTLDEALQALPTVSPS